MLVVLEDLVGSSFDVMVLFPFATRSSLSSFLFFFPLPSAHMVSDLKIWPPVMAEFLTRTEFRNMHMHWRQNIRKWEDVKSNAAMFLVA